MKAIGFAWALSFFLTGLVRGAIQWPSKTYIIPSRPQAGNTEFITKGSEGPFDGPKSSFINSSVLEWWYFDVQNAEGNEGIGVWFMMANPVLFGLPLSSSNWFILHTRFADGTGEDTFVEAGDAIILTFGEGSSGQFLGTGSGWVGSPDLKSWAVTLDIPEKNISGSFYIKSRTEPHSAVRPMTDRSANLMNIGTMGWVIPVQAGDPIAYVKVGAKTIQFDQGTGYHDHNWGGSLGGFVNWYAIRAEAGPYAWSAIEAIRMDGSIFNLAWLTYENKTILASLDTGCVTIRPWGNNAQYPPRAFYPQPLGATIDFNAGSEGTYSFNLTSKTNSPGLNFGEGLAKWFGTITGGKGEEDEYNGPAMFEWLDIAMSQSVSHDDFQNVMGNPRIEVSEL